MLKESLSRAKHGSSTGSGNPGPSFPLTETLMTIPVSPGFSPRVKVIHPSIPTTRPRPLIVLLHGGGFVRGPIDYLRPHGVAFAEEFNAVVVLGTYRLVPTVRWPVPWKDSWNLLAYLSKHAHEPKFGSAELDANKGGGFVVGGTSAGASCAAVCGGIDAFGVSSDEGVDELASRLTGVMANVPFLLVPQIVPQEWRSRWTAWQDNERVKGFNTNTLRAVIQGIQCSNYSSRWFSPIPDLCQGDDQLHGHPRVYMTYCHFDPLRDDALVYSELLRRRGVKVKTDLFPDDGHTAWSSMGFAMRSKNPSIPEANMEGMRWLLRR